MGRRSWIGVVAVALLGVGLTACGGSMARAASHSAGASYAEAAPVGAPAIDRGGDWDVVEQSAASPEQLRFGYDQGSEPHLYFVTIFIAEGGVFSRSKLFLIEAGGKKELVEQEAAQIDYAITNFRH